MTLVSIVLLREGYVQQDFLGIFLGMVDIPYVEPGVFVGLQLGRLPYAGSERIDELLFLLVDALSVVGISA